VVGVGNTFKERMDGGDFHVIGGRGHLKPEVKKKGKSNNSKRVTMKDQGGIVGWERLERARRTCRPKEKIIGGHIGNKRMSVPIS